MCLLNIAFFYDKCSLSFRDPMFLEYLDKIGQHFFGVPPPQRGPPPGGMLSGIFDSLLSGLVITTHSSPVKYHFHRRGGVLIISWDQAFIFLPEANKGGHRQSNIWGGGADRLKLMTPSSLSRTLNSPRALLPELQRYKDTVICVVLGTEVPGHCQEQLTHTFMVRLLKTHLFSLFPKIRWAWASLGPGPTVRHPE